jgi:hypothetical protein
MADTASLATPSATTEDVMASMKQLADAHDAAVQKAQAQVQLREQALSAPNVDRKTGASLAATAAVGAAPTPQDELSTLRKYYADALPLGDGNYVFTHPDTKQPTLYKATEGMHPLNWAARNFQEIPALAGGIGGAIGGGAAGTTLGPAGTIGGAIAGAGVGGTAGLEGYRGLMRGLLGTDDTRSAGQVATDVGVNTALGSLGEGAGRAIPAVARAVMPIVGKAEPGVLRAAADLGPDMQRAISNVPGMITGSTGLNRTMEALGASPTATGRLEGGKEAFRDVLTRAQQTLASDIAGGPTRSTADTGVAMDKLKRAFQGGVDSFNQVRQAMDTTVDAFSHGVVVVPHNVQNAVTQLERSVAGGSQNLAPTVADALDFGRNILDRNRLNTITNGRPGIDFGAMRQERTALGDAIKWNPDTGAARTPSAQNAMQTMYDAVKQDLLDSAQRANPNLRQALAAHDNFVTTARGGQGNIRPGVGAGQYLTVDELGDLIKKDPSALFDTLTTNAFKSGLNGGNGTELARIRNSVDPQTWKETAAHYFERMFQPNPGVPQTAGQVAGSEPVSGIANFATHWNAMSDGAKRAMFDGVLPAGQRTQLDSLAILANQYKKAGLSANVSQSGNLLTAGRMLFAPLTGAGVGAASNEPGGAVKGLAIGAAPLVAAPMLMRLMQSPGFTRWLASSAREVAASPNRISTTLGRLAAMQFDAPTKAAVDKYIQAAQAKISGASAPAGATP